MIKFFLKHKVNEPELKQLAGSDSWEEVKLKWGIMLSLSEPGRREPDAQTLPSHPHRNSMNLPASPAHTCKWVSVGRFSNGGSQIRLYTDDTIWSFTLQHPPSSSASPLWRSISLTFISSPRGLNACDSYTCPHKITWADGSDLDSISSCKLLGL